MAHSSDHPRRRRDHDEVIQMYSVNPAYEDISPQNGEHRPPFVVDVPPHIPLDRRQESSSAPYDEDPSMYRRDSSRPWASSSHKETAELLNQLPSKQLEQVASTTAHTIRRRKTRKKSFHGTIRGHKQLEDLTASLSRDSNLMDELDGEVRTNEVLRDMPVNLSDKREIRDGLQESRQKMTLRRGSRKPGWIKRTKYSLGIAWMHFKYRMAEIAYSLELWRSLLKRVEGHFGTGVTSYFLFLKWIFLLNIPVFILTFAFIIIPQILYIANPESAIQTSTPNVTFNATSNITTQAPSAVISKDYVFTGEELLTGGNYFTETVMYYGYYTDNALNLVGDTVYDMQYAYLFTCGGYYLLCLIILALSISRSYKKNYIEASGTFNFYIVTKVFCGWDYNIAAEDAATLRHKSFKNEVKEFLSGKKYEEDEKSLAVKCKWFFIRTLTNLLVFGMIGGSAYLIFFVSDTDSIQTGIYILGDLAMSLIATSVIFFLPFIFDLIGQLEKYQKPQTELYVGMVRTMLLKASILAILAYFWFSKRAKLSCWETGIGTDIYRLVLVDFIFILISTFFMEFIRRLLSKHCCTRLSEPEFNIGRNTLDLIYSQALCWLGTFYSPLLSLIMSIKLFIIFYIKVISCLMNCKPSVRPWRASKTHTIFLGFLFFFFLLAAVAVAYGIFRVTPSVDCGPFRGKDKTYDIVTILVDSWKDDLDVLREIVNVISSPGFIASVLVAICVITYYMRIVMIGHKEMVKLLRQQLAMEGRDKSYLLNLLQEASRKKKEKPLSLQTSRLLSPGLSGSVESLGRKSPGGRQFARTLADNAALKTPTDSPVPSRRGRQFDSQTNNRF